ncbi:MAG: hypothetical protein FJY98_02825 [Candidatus Liptonbacteria bacterium]|nr:hypothetical protein [Candidatus Liptonbacteria bacterium]
MDITTEAAEAQFVEQGATRCVVVPTPNVVTLDDIVAVSSQAWIPDVDEAGDDKIVVRLGADPQKAYEPDQLFTALRLARGEVIVLAPYREGENKEN